MIHHYISSEEVQHLNELHVVQKCGKCNKFSHYKVEGMCNRTEAHYIACDDFEGIDNKQKTIGAY